MILEKETFEKFGYYPRDLKPQSSKRILAACDECGIIREIDKSNYRSLCLPCARQGKNNSFFGKHHSEETKVKLRKYTELNNRDWLYQKYWIEERTERDIADIIGCSKSSIGPALKKKGVRRRTRSEAHKGIHVSEETKKKLSDALIKTTPIQRKLNRNISRYINYALKGTKNRRHWETLVGYTLAELMQTLEKEFRQGMTWDNYGAWHVDHMIPLAKFKFDSTHNPEFKKAWALGNLQPLWADENIKKSDKFMFF